MDKIIFEFGYEGGCDIAEYYEGKIVYHTALTENNDGSFDNLQDFWNHYITTNKYWKRSAHRYKVSPELKPIIKDSLIKEDIIKYYERAIERCEAAIIDFNRTKLMMVERFELEP